MQIFLALIGSLAARLLKGDRLKETATFFVEVFSAHTEPGRGMGMFCWHVAAAGRLQTGSPPSPEE